LTGSAGASCNKAALRLIFVAAVYDDHSRQLERLGMKLTAIRLPQPSCLIWCTQSAPTGGASRSTGWAGTMNPIGNLSRNVIMRGW
jgi:hypothetical protein